MSNETVYVVHHQYEWRGRDELKFIGVYATQAEAEAAVAQLRDQPGFRDWPDGFTVDAWPLGGAPCWPDGFATMVGILVPTTDPGGRLQGAMAAWHPGELYEVCSLDEPSTSTFREGQVVRCTEQVIDGVKQLVATELVRDEL